MVNYKDAGVDVERGYKAVQLMKEHVKKTFNRNVLGDVGGFGGLYSLSGMTGGEPVLVAGTDGVGTKLKLAFALNKHDTVGIDCVAMSVNDVVCQGARPLFFLDYLATGRIEPEKVADIVKGVAEGCLQAGCALIGGETAEMPGFYLEGEYDLAGFAVGIADRSSLVTGKDIKPGDALIGLASSGVHSNGFSLVRKLLGDDRAALDKYIADLGETVGEALMRPTKIYVKTALALMQKFCVKGAAHITGGGFTENIPRMLPEGARALVWRGGWPVPPIFGVLQSLGKIADEAIYNTYNMGVGMALCVPAAEADAAIRGAEALGDKAYVIGEVVPGDVGLTLA